MKRNNFLRLFFILTIIFLGNCTTDDNGSNGEPTPTNNPVPTLSGIAPNSKVENMPSFTLTATGSNFVQGSKIVYDGAEKSTTFVSATEITCQINPADLSLSSSSLMGQEKLLGTSDKGVNVLVRNPAPGGGDSETKTFSINENHTFYVPQNVSNNSTTSGYPDIESDGAENLYMVWQDYDSGNSELFFSHSTDQGNSWSLPVNISNTSGSSYYSEMTVAGDGSINVVWYDKTPGNNDIYFTRSDDNGGSWSSPLNISESSGTSYYPNIAADSDNNLNVVWYDPVGGNYEILHSRSTDSGSNWSTPVNISDNSSVSYNADIAIDGDNNLNVVWEDYKSGNGDIFFSRSTNNGSSWSNPKNISNNAGKSVWPKIAINSNDLLCVAWHDETPGNQDIFFSRSSNNGGSWIQPKNVSDSAGHSAWVFLCIDRAGNINLVWDDKTSGNYDIYFSRSVNNGNNWSPFEDLTDNSASTRYTRMAVDPAGNLYIVWANGSTKEIYFTGSTQ